MLQEGTDTVMSIKSAEAVKVGEARKRDLPVWRSYTVLEAMNRRHGLRMTKGSWAQMGSRRRKIYTELNSGGQRR